MRIQCRIGEVPRSSIASTDILPSLFILPGLPDFFLLNITLFLYLHIIFDHVVVDHIHLLMSFGLPHGLIVEPLANRDEIFLWWVRLIGVDSFILPSFSVGLKHRHRATQMNLKQLIYISYLNNWSPYIYRKAINFTIWYVHPQIINGAWATRNQIFWTLFVFWL